MKLQANAIISDYANAKATTVYAASGDHIFYRNVRLSRPLFFTKTTLICDKIGCLLNLPFVDVVTTL